MNSNWSYGPETPNLGQNRCFLSRVTLKFARWSWKTIGHLFHVASSFVHHLKAIDKEKLKSQSRNARFGSKSAIFVLCDLEIWWMTLKNNRAPLLCCFKLCASFHSHQWILIGVTVRKPPIWVKINNFFSRVTLKFDRWPWKTIAAPLLCYFGLCVSFRSYWSIQTGVTVQKLPIWVKIDYFFSRVTL